MSTPPRPEGDPASSLERAPETGDEGADVEADDATVASPDDGTPDGATESDEAGTGEPGADGDGEGSSLERPEHDDPREADEIAVDRQQVRRAPRFGRFAAAGIVLGLLVAAAQTAFANPDDVAFVTGPWVSGAWGFWLLMSAIFVPIGALLGCGLALLADRRSRRRQTDGR